VFRAAGAPVTWRGELLAAVLWAGDGAAASHRAAAALWQLDGCEPGIVELAVSGRRAPRGRPGVKVHRVNQLDPSRLTAIDGVPVTGIELTLVHLAGVVGFEALAGALDSALVQGLTRADRVLVQVDRMGRRGRRGIGRLVGLLEHRIDGHRPNESRFERRLARLVASAGLGEPTAQHEVRVDGRLVARVDLAYPDLRVAIEADSHRWHAGRSSWERDLARRTALAADGWLVLHFSWRDLVTRPEYVVRRVAATVASRTFAP
jgi:very-short-patch-repair endonuclease